MCVNTIILNNNIFVKKKYKKSLTNKKTLKHFLKINAQLQNKLYSRYQRKNAADYGKPAA